MVQIIVNDTVLPIMAAGIRLEYVNNLFNEGFIQGDYSFPFSIAINESVKMALGFVSLLDMATKTYQYECNIHFKSQFYGRGILEVNGIEGNTLNVNLKLGVKGDSFIDKNLKSYDYGGKIIDNIGITNYANKTALTTDWRLYPVCFIPHTNQRFYNTDNPDFLGVVNQIEVSSKQYFFNTSQNAYCLVPWPYLFFILDHISRTEGYILQGSFIEDEDASKIVLYNNYSLDKQQDFFSVFIEKSFDQFLPNQMHVVDFYKNDDNDSDPDNCWQNTNEYTIKAAGQHVIDLHVAYNGGYCQFAVLPFTWNIEVSGVGIFPVFFDGINNNNITGGIELIKDFTYTYNASASDINRKITVKYILNNASLPGPYVGITVRSASYISIVNKDMLGFNAFEKEIDLKNHVPGISVGDFLNELKKAFGLLINIKPSTKKITLDWNSTSINQKAKKDLSKKLIMPMIVNIDLEDKGYIYGYEVPSDDELCKDNFKTIDPAKYLGEVNTFAQLGTAGLPGTVKLVLNQNKYYISASGIWEYYSDRNELYRSGKETEEIKSSYLPMLMDIGTVVDNASGVNRNVLMPFISQQGSSNSFGIGINEATPRFIFNHGLQNIPGSLSKQYVYGSSTGLDAAGNRLTAFSLLTGGKDGLYEMKVKSWLLLLLNKETLECLFVFNYLDLVNFDQYDVVYLSNRNYLIKSASIELANSILPVKLYLSHVSV